MWPEEFGSTDETCAEERVAFSWFVCVCVVSAKFFLKKASRNVDQQVMEMTERMRQSEEAAEQARQLLESHKTAVQMLEERMNRTAASVSHVSSWRIRPDRAQVPEAPGADDGDSDLEHLEQDTNRSVSVARTLDGVTGPVVSYLGRTVSTWTSARSHPSIGSPTWRRSHCDLSWTLDSMTGQVLS